MNLFTMANRKKIFTDKAGNSIYRVGEKIALYDAQNRLVGAKYVVPFIKKNKLQNIEALYKYT